MTAPDLAAGSPGPAGAPSAVRGAGRRTDAVTAALSVWFTAGLLLDAWAHNNVPGLESFFTPWHAVFYSGFAVTAAWLAWSVRGPLLAPGPLAVRWRAVPAATRPALAAVGVFALAGVGDMTWHVVLGIEQDITILFSPTHLALAGSMLVIVTTPLRTASADPALPAAPGLRLLGPAVTATAIATVLVLLFLQYGNALVREGGSWVAALAYTDRLFTAWVTTSTALTSLVLVAPLVLLARRWRLPVGTVTVVVGSCCVLSAAVTGGRDGTTAVAAGVAAVVCDGLVRVLRPGPDRPRAALALGALVPFLVWTTVLAAALLTTPGLDTRLLSVEITTGLPVVQGGVGFLLAALTAGRGAGAPPVSGAVRVPAGGEQVGQG